MDRASIILGLAAVMAAGYAGLGRFSGYAYAQPAVPAAEGEERVIVSLSVNGQIVDDAVLAIRRPDGFYIPKTALTEARLRVGDTARLIEGPGTEYVALSSLSGVQVQFDSGMQELKLQADATVFDGQIIELSPRREAMIAKSAFGAFLNYDAIAQRGTDPGYAASLFDLGGPVGGGSFLASGLARSSSIATEFIRLDTSYTQDFTGDMMRVKVGDAISRGGDWGRPARFGGVQLATNFAVQPGYVPFPTANFSGQAALPSTVDIFVNDALRYRGRVDQGPFELNQIPALTGGGDARVVLTDPLGRQQAVTLPFYVSPAMLRDGVSDYSYEVGALRTGYATPQSRYDKPIASATHRYGLSDTHTVEGHAEAMDTRQAVGTSLTSTILPFGEFHEEVAVSNVPGGNGWLAGIGYSRTERDWSFGIRQRWQSDNFDEGGVVFSVVGSPLRSETLINASYSLGKYGSVSASIARQTYDNALPATITSANWSLPVTERAYLSVYALSAEQEVTSRTVGLTLTVLFGPGTTATSDNYSRGGQMSNTLQLRETPMTETGWAYGASASRGELERRTADLTRRTSSGDFGIAADQYDGRNNGRLSASGGIALVESKIYTARRIDDAFGVVSVPGYPEVTVMQENRPIGKTDKDGNLFVPRLQSYNENRISLATGDLPIDTTLDNLETTVMPGHRGIVNVGFAASLPTARLVTVRHALANDFVEPGVQVIRRSDGRVFRSGFEGQVYVDGAPDDMFLVEDGRGTCGFRLPADAGRLSVIICEVMS